MENIDRKKTDLKNTARYVRSAKGEQNAHVNEVESVSFHKYPQSKRRFKRTLSQNFKNIPKNVTVREIEVNE